MPNSVKRLLDVYESGGRVATGVDAVRRPVGVGDHIRASVKYRAVGLNKGGDDWRTPSVS